VTPAATALAKAENPNVEIERDDAARFAMVGGSISRNANAPTRRKI
jgi:hypothetical protein